MTPASKQKQLADHHIGDGFAGFLLIQNVTKGVAKNGKPFLTLFLTDKSGTIDTKIWNATEDDTANYVRGTVVYLTGAITEFREQKQLQTAVVRMATPQDPVSPGDLIATAPVSIDSMRDLIDQTIFNLHNPIFQKITRAIIERHDKEFFLYPAATFIHHEFLSGLAYHTTTMLRVADALCAIYTELNADLLKSAIILHDVGKIAERVSETDSTHTLAGSLIEHITIIACEIKETAKALGIDPNSEDVIVLEHMILAHHGKREWGSPVLPHIREAEVLHQIDNIDAKMNVMNKALAKVEPGTFTEKLFALDNRAFYKPTC